MAVLGGATYIQLVDAVNKAGGFASLGVGAIAALAGVVALIVGGFLRQ